jgi:hypothetical protein
MKVDYVRVYQQEGKESITCDPADHPTSQYIKEYVALRHLSSIVVSLTLLFLPSLPSPFLLSPNRNSHLNAYSDPNITTWADAGYTFPKNSLQGC